MNCLTSATIHSFIHTHTHTLTLPIQPQLTHRSTRASCAIACQAARQHVCHRQARGACFEQQQPDRSSSARAHQPSSAWARRLQLQQQHSAAAAAADVAVAAGVPASAAWAVNLARRRTSATTVCQDSCDSRRLRPLGVVLGHSRGHAAHMRIASASVGNGLHMPSFSTSHKHEKCVFRKHLRVLRCISEHN